MLSYVNIAQLPLSPRRLDQRNFPPEMLKAVLDTETGKLMGCRRLMKNPKYRELYGQNYTKESGRLAQGTLGQIKGTNPIFFIDKSNFPADRWKDVTYGRIVVSFQT